MNNANEQHARCTVCPHACELVENQLGACKARVARGGAVVPQNYGRITALALDPIEKKPLACFQPGKTVLSVGSYGCNLTCPFCQNNGISQAGENAVPWRATTPDELVEHALRLRSRGCIGVAYTYNEPLVGFEFVRDCARRVHDAGLANVLVSNGFAQEGIIRELAPLIDAANIDLKGFTSAFYRSVGGHLEPVKRTIELLAAQPTCHLELTTLVVPGMNDSPAEIESLATWIATLDPRIPLHLSRFFPRWRMSDAAPTPLETMLAAQRVAGQHLERVFLGNV